MTSVVSKNNTGLPKASDKHLEKRDGAAVENLKDKALPFYQSEAREAVKDEQTLALYDNALAEIKGWLSTVLRNDILENGYNTARATLYLPSGDMEVEARAADFWSDAPLFLGRHSRSVPERFHTPIGDFDLYTYNAVVWEKDNPVRQLFEYFDGIITSLRGSLSHALAERNQYLITEELLREYKWYDVFGLHRMMYGSLDDVLPRP